MMKQERQWLERGRQTKKSATRGRRRKEHGSKQAAGKVNKQKNDCKNDETRSKVEEARTEEEMGNKKKKRARRNQ